MNSTVGVHTDKSNDTFKQLLNVDLYMEEGPLVDPAEEMLGEGDQLVLQEQTPAKVPIKSFNLPN